MKTTLCQKLEDSNVSLVAMPGNAFTGLSKVQPNFSSLSVETLNPNVSWEIIDPVPTPQRPSLLNSSANKEPSTPVIKILKHNPLPAGIKENMPPVFGDGSKLAQYRAKNNLSLNSTLQNSKSISRNTPQKPQEDNSSSTPDRLMRPSTLSNVKIPCTPNHLDLSKDAIPKKILATPLSKDKSFSLEVVNIKVLKTPSIKDHDLSCELLPREVPFSSKPPSFAPILEFQRTEDANPVSNIASVNRKSSDLEISRNLFHNTCLELSFAPQSLLLSSMRPSTFSNAEGSKAIEIRQDIIEPIQASENFAVNQSSETVAKDNIPLCNPFHSELAETAQVISEEPVSLKSGLNYSLSGSIRQDLIIKPSIDLIDLNYVESSYDKVKIGPKFSFECLPLNIATRVETYELPFEEDLKDEENQFKQCGIFSLMSIKEIEESGERLSDYINPEYEVNSLLLNSAKMILRNVQEKLVSEVQPPENLPFRCSFRPSLLIRDSAGSSDRSFLTKVLTQAETIPEDQSANKKKWSSSSRKLQALGTPTLSFKQMDFEDLPSEQKTTPSSSLALRVIPFSSVEPRRLFANLTAKTENKLPKFSETKSSQSRTRQEKSEIPTRSPFDFAPKPGDEYYESVSTKRQTSSRNNSLPKKFKSRTISPYSEIKGHVRSKQPMAIYIRIPQKKRDEECTFHPRITSKHTPSTSFEDRNRQWVQNRNQKMFEKVSKKTQTEKDEESEYFSPQLTKRTIELASKRSSTVLSPTVSFSRKLRQPMSERGSSRSYFSAWDREISEINQLLKFYDKMSVNSDVTVGV